MYLFCKWLYIRHLCNHVKSTCQYTQKQAIICKKISKIAYISNIIITKSLLLLADNRCKLVIWSNKDINRTFVQIEYSIISYIMHDGMLFQCPWHQHFDAAIVILSPHPLISSHLVSQFPCDTFIWLQTFLLYDHYYSNHALLV